MSEGALSEALAAATEAERLHRELSNHIYRLIDLARLGEIFLAMEKPDAALWNYAEGEGLARQLGKADECAEFLAAQGLCYAAQGQLTISLKVFKESADLYGSLGNVGRKVTVLEHMLRVHAAIKEAQPTLETLRELAREYRNLERWPELVKCLYTQSTLYLIEDAYNPERANALLTEALDICAARDLTQEMPKIGAMLAEVRKPRRTAIESLGLSAADLTGEKIATYRIRSSTTEADGTRVLSVWDEFRQRRFQIRITRDNPIWDVTLLGLDSLTNLREQTERIHNSFQARRQAAISGALLVESEHTGDILMRNSQGRLVLINEPRSLEHALRIEDLDRRAAREHIPFSSRVIRGAYSLFFTSLIAASVTHEGAEGANRFGEDDLILLADREFLGLIGERIKQLDRRHTAGEYAEILDRVLTGTHIMRVGGEHPPVQQNILILLMGLGESGQVSSRQVQQTLYNKEFRYNLAPSYILQVEALIPWIERCGLPDQVARNYRWLCNTAWELYRTNPADQYLVSSGHLSTGDFVVSSAPVIAEADALCVESEMP